jgi:glyoxylase-like metal-dependent hydrolase (beta-lactamase superfamily II)/rhodanese-related sulfurtransferase
VATGPSALPHPFFRPPREGAVPLIAPRELAQLLLAGTPPLLLDVRPAWERRLVHLPNDRSVPLEDLEAALATLPHDRPIVAYDHLGYRARAAVDFLGARGFPLAAALEGGVDEYARVVDDSLPRYPVDAPECGLLLRQLPRPETGCLAYLVADANAGVAVVIDPGLDATPYRTLLAEQGWKLAAIVETHTHADHLAGHAALHASTDAPIWVSHRSPAAYPHRRLADGDAIEFGEEAIEVLETPGHTRDHLTLRLRDKIFTGDTLLLGSVGRTDLGDGSPDLLFESLTEKLLRLPEGTEVYPAHFGSHHALPDRYVSTLGFERASNEALRLGSRDAFRTYMTEGWPPKPADFDRIVAANLSD